MRIVLNTYEATKKIKTGVENHALQLIQILKKHHQLEAIVQENRKINLYAQYHKSQNKERLAWYMDHLKVINAFYRTLLFKKSYDKSDNVYREINLANALDEALLHPIYRDFTKVHKSACIYDAIKFRYWLQRRKNLIAIPKMNGVDAFWNPATFPMYMKGVWNICNVHDTFVNGTNPINISDVNRKQKKLKYLLETYDLIFTVSQYTKNELIQCFPSMEYDKVHVSYQALPNKVKQLPDEKQQLKLLNKLQLKPNNYFLHVSTLLPRKNQQRLISAYLKSNVTCPLIMIGKKSKVTEEVLLKSIEKANPKVIWLNYLNDLELNTLYLHAKAFVLPSLYEGFGITLLEAFYHGCPVITSNTTSMPEVAGDAAVYVNPESIDNIKTAIETVNDNNELRLQLITAGKKQLNNFTNEAISKKINLALAKLNHMNKAYG